MTDHIIVIAAERPVRNPDVWIGRTRPMRWWVGTEAQCWHLVPPTCARVDPTPRRCRNMGHKDGLCDLHRSMLPVPEVGT